MPGPKPILQDTARIGIVNRGEAAIRFIRAVRDFNRLEGTDLKTVAFYIDREKNALFSREADFAYPLHEFPSYRRGKGSPYLDRPLLLEALTLSGCTAVWVGWGFVSEDSEFAALVEQANLVFLGPDSRAMALLGDKIAAKELAEKAEVPICPWSRGPVNTLKEAEEVAERIGYPVIVKAANAGGGRGIRFVLKPEDLKSQFQSAVEETFRITGNRVVFIERLVQKGRHLEVQVLVDRYGNVKTFGVRDCSVQRKNQKIIEETPPPGFSQETIRKMEDAALRLVKAAGYESAGTVEFLYDLIREEFYFMEVNTRLQVEHPITEQLYGIDLVQGQIRVARGESIANWKVEPRGSVIEVRLNAEDPQRDFRPSPGLVSTFRPPAGPGIRIDSGIDQGSEIPPDFDSMVAKVIASGPNRPATLARLERALMELRIRIEGGTTNRAFLLGLLRNPDIRKGGVHTRFVEELLSAGKEIFPTPDWDVALVVGAIERYLGREQEELTNFTQQMLTFGSPRDLRPGTGYEVEVSAKGNRYSFLVKALDEETFLIKDEQDLTVRYQKKSEESQLWVAGNRYGIQIVERGDVLQVEVNGIPYELEFTIGGVIKSPSPGVVLSIPVRGGDKVEKGDVLLTLEAMKMEVVVPASADGIVREVRVRPGEQVGAGQVLVLLEAMEQGGESKEQPKGERVTIQRLRQADVEYQWNALKGMVKAVLLGYDGSLQVTELYREIKTFQQAHPSYSSRVKSLWMEGLNIFATIERLFSTHQVDPEGELAPVSSLELLSHFFKRTVDRKKGFPPSFLSALEHALKLYGIDMEEDTERARKVLYRLFKSRAALSAKQDLLLSILATPQDLEGSGENLSDLLDEIALISQPSRQTLADAAINARYHLFDRFILQSIREQKSARVGRILSLLLKGESIGRTSESLMDRLLDLGEQAVPEFIRIIQQGAPSLRSLALEALARRLNRDRKVESVTVVERKGKWIAEVRSFDGEEESITLVTYLDPSDPTSVLNALGELSMNPSRTGNPTTMEWVAYTENDDPAEVFDTFSKSLQRATMTSQQPWLCDWVSLGISEKGGKVTYRTWTLVGDDGTGKRFVEDGGRLQFGPLQYRELRLYRLTNFQLEYLTGGEEYHLVRGVAKENPRDERIFAFVEVSTTRPEFTSDGRIGRMVAFEHVFMEAIYAFRNEQIKRKHRLFWNRIVIHIRPVLDISVHLIQEYAERMAARTLGLGMERLTLYCRFINEDRQVQEKELLFDNIVGTNFTIRVREPSRKPMVPMDEYVAKVVRARQRGTVYPYEIIRMLTSRSNDSSFEEYDLALFEGASSPKPAYRSVKGRPYGMNTANIVFGIIENPLSDGRRIKRVIILSDPTTDLGSLAEGECRRVNAAIDLAEDLGLPVEFLPISAGARIDMDSGTENLDWTAATLKRIIEFTQRGGVIHIIVAGTNVGAQSYWNAEATMLMHTKGLLIMTETASMLLTGKKALDFSGSVSAEDNLGIGGAEKIMEPNGQAQIRVKDLQEAYEVLFHHYSLTYMGPGETHPVRVPTKDPLDRDVGAFPYRDTNGQGFSTIGDIFSAQLNPERKKPFDIRQVMAALIDQDTKPLERWAGMRDAETSVVWEARIGGFAVGLIGIESKPLPRKGEIPYDGPESWSGGTLFPLSSKKTARAINSWSGRLPVVFLANLSGFDGSPESLRKLQLEYGAEIGRAVVNFKGPFIFVVIARYHGGAYVVFSKYLNPNLHVVALEGAYASVIGGAPAAAVVFPSQVLKETYADPEVQKAQERLRTDKSFNQKDFDEIFRRVHSEKQSALAARFDRIHSVERALKVGSIDAIIPVSRLRPYVVERIERELTSSSAR
ncbi:MAG: biotin/lipoyl-binding protein [Spirochaetes bacterium]|nr:biotin/lipoyl-binding protein [Spirochaetota bacterium]